MPSVLISGASIAGPVLAWWLERAGIEAVLVERAPAPRPGGQAIDVRGAALEVLRRMNLLDAALDLRTTMTGVVNLDGEGRELSRSDEMTLSGGRLANDDFEILRDDLSALLMGGRTARIETIFDDSIAAIDDVDGGLAVTFERAAPRRFDLVVGADGVHSQVRALRFGDERLYLRPVGVALAVYSAPNHLGLEDRQIVCRGEDGAMCIVSPVRGNSELRLCYSFRATPEEEAHGDVAAQKALLAERCGRLGWEVPGLLAAMWSAPDFYLGVIAQIAMPGWTRGRVGLVGDAAYCPSPATGQGTSLAIVGGFVLAQELERRPHDHAAAFSAYEARMRPFVDANHALLAALREEGQGQGGWLARLDRAKNAIQLDPGSS